MSSSIKFQCVDDSGNPIFLVDSINGIYHKNTTNSSNASTGALLLYGGLSINSTTNSTNASNGGVLTVGGGASFGKDVYIGGDLRVYGSQTFGNVTLSNLTSGNILTNNINLGISNIYSGSFTSTNNQLIAANVSGLSFPNANINSFIINLTVNITANSNNYYETFVLEGTQTNSGWSLFSTKYGDNSGIVFSITSDGQIQYTSTNINNFTNGLFNFSVNQITKTGSYSYVNTTTQGTLVADVIQILSTNDSNLGVNNGSLYLLGGATISKSLYVGTLISSSNAILTNISSNSLNTSNISSSVINSNTLISSANITSSIITTGILNSSTLISSANISSSTISTNSLISTTSITSGALYSTNCTITNIVGTTISTGTIVASSSSLPLSIFQSNIGDNTIARLVGNGGANNTYSIETGSYFNGTIGTVRISFQDGGNFSSSINFSTKQSGSENTTMVERMRIASDGSVGIGTTSPGTTLDVSGTLRATTSITSGAMYATNITATNIVSTNNTVTNAVHTSLSTGTLAVTTNVTSGALYTTNITATNIVSTALSTGTLSAITSVTSGALYATNITATNIVSPSISAGTIVGSNSTVTNAVHTALSTGTLSVTTNVTSGAMYASNITATNIVGTALSTGILSATTSVTSGALYANNITAINIVGTTISAGTIVGTNSTVTNAVHTALSAGTLAATTSITSAAMYSNNITATHIVGTNISSGTIVSTNITSTNIVGTTITTGTLVATTSVTSAALYVNNITAAQIVGANISSGTILGTNSTVTNAVHTALSTGTLAVTTSVTSAALYANNITGVNVVGTTISAGTIVGNLSSANISSLIITSGTLNASTLISSANISSAIISTGTLVGSTININGTTRIINTSANSIGTLVIAGPGSSSYLPAITTIGQLMSIYGPGGTNAISNIDLSTFEPTPSAMNLPAVRFSMQDLGGWSTSFNVLTKNYGSTGTMASRVFIDGSGNIGINTTSPGDSLDLRGNLRIGNNTQSNYISFYGIYGDGVGDYSHTFIGERLYNSTEQSELLLFKGNDTGSSAAGPDRIRLLAAEHRFDTYTSPVSGSFENVASTVASNRMIINSAGNVGIGTASPIFTLDVSGTARFVTSVTSAALYANNITATNIVGISNISTGSLLATTSVTSAALYGLNITGTNIVGTNISSGTLLASTRVSSANLNCNIISSATLITTNITSTNIVGISNISTGTLVATTRVSSANLNTSIISTGTLIARNNSNTLGTLYTTGGNVGINKTNPQANLHIQSTNVTSLLSSWSGAGSYSNIDFSYDDSSLLGVAASARIKVLDNNFGADIYIQNRDQGSDNSNMNTRLFIGATGDIGIGTENPSSKLEILTSDTIGLRHTGFYQISVFPLLFGTTQLETYINNKGGWLRTSTNDALNFAVNNGNSSMTINTNGNIGIGTTSPATPLEVSVNGSGSGIRHTNSVNGISVETYTTSAAAIIRTATNHPLRFAVDSGSPIVVLSTRGSMNVGINNYTSFRGTLDVQPSSVAYHSTVLMTDYAQTISYDTSTNGSLGIAFGISSTDVMTPGASIIHERTGNNSLGLLHFCTKSGTATVSPTLIRMTIQTSGNIGIGTTSPAYQLQLSSDSAAKPSTNTWTVSSDERLKTNIQLADLDICYNIIKNLPLKRYTWKDDVYTVEEVPDRSKLGWIAQDVELVIPKAVEKVSMLGYEDCRTLNSDQIIASLYGCVQKLIKINEYQDEQIHNLNEEINKTVSENEIKNIEMRHLIERISLLEERIYNNFSA